MRKKITVTEQPSRLKKFTMAIATSTQKASRPVWLNIKNWKLEYALLPLSAVVVLLLKEFAYRLSGRAATENADALVGFGFQVMKFAALIFGLSVVKEAVGHWWTKAEIKQQPILAWPGAIVTLTIAICATYLFTH